MRRDLTDRLLRSLKVDPSGRPLDVMDAVVGGFGVRVLAGAPKRPRVTFILLTRFPGSSNPTRRKLGTFGAMTLEQARNKARLWLELIRKGIDPSQWEEEQRLAEIAKREDTFEKLAEAYLRDAVFKLPPEQETQLSRKHRNARTAAPSPLRSAAHVARDIRNELVPRWGQRPATAITREDVKAMVQELVDRGARYQAHSLLGHTRRIFNWALDRRGFTSSPCDRLSPKRLIGPRKPRERVFDEIDGGNFPEIRAFWAATHRMGDVWGPLLRLLLLTGQRKSEITNASWPEINFDQHLWTIPRERMKGGRPHEVPLTDWMIDIIKTVTKPAGKKRKGDFVFSVTGGESPLNSFSKMKTRLDVLMLEELRKENPTATLQPFVLHDIRRTVRTRLSELCRPHIAEAVIAHQPHGIEKVYNLSTYRTEKRKALEDWGALLRNIVDPRERKVVRFPSAS